MAKRRRRKTVRKTPIQRLGKNTFSDRPGTTIIEDIQWVSEHLPVPGMKIEDAPSARAWDWYKRYHKTSASRSDFDTVFMAKLVSAVGDSGRTRFQDEEHEVIKHLDEYEEASRQIRENVLPIQEPEYAASNN